MRPTNPNKMHLCIIYRGKHTVPYKEEMCTIIKQIPVYADDTPRKYNHHKLL